MEILPGIHRIESDLGEQRTVLVDTGLAGTPEEVIVPYLEEIGLGVGDVDEVIVSHADVAHFGLLGPNR
jgi:beta-lactamase superfamily II metal-dependent hydrolase